MSKKKILIVDDEPDIVTNMEMFLESNGYDILQAFDGKEALEKTRQYQPNLILLDIMMPHINGLQVCRTLKTHKETKHIPIIIVTAKTQTDEVVEATKAGADEYITKPFELKELLSKIEKHLANQLD